MIEMKDSGVDWIGKIPNSWASDKVKYHFSNTKRIVGTKVNEYQRLALTLKGVIKRSKDDNEGLQPSEFRGYQILKNGELVFKLIDLQNTATSRVGLSSYTGIVSPAYIVLNGNDSIVPSFAEKYFLSMWHRNIFNHLGDSGVRSNLNAQELLNVSIAYPNIMEQHKIADFLDQKCSEIDALTADIQTQIGTLEEYKKSVITEAVTKGLDPNVEMKDSGVDFIGYMPSHWKTLRIKYIGTYFNGLTYSPQDICEPSEGTLVLRSSNIKNSKLDLNDCVYVSRNINSSKMVKPEDILICSRNGSRELVGKSAYITDIKASFGAFMMILRPCALVKSKYIFYILNSGVFSYYLASFFTSTINQLTANNFGNMKIPFVGSLDEQHQIADFLDQKCSEIDQTISEKQQQLETLAEYKKSLIYEYVTGKKEVA